MHWDPVSGRCSFIIFHSMEWKMGVFEQRHQPHIPIPVHAKSMRLGSGGCGRSADTCEQFKMDLDNGSIFRTCDYTMTLIFLITQWPSNTSK